MSNTQKYEVATVNHIDVLADVSLLNQNDDLFFNATTIAKQFDKQVSDFLRLDSTKEYIEAIMQESGNGNSPFQNLVRTTKGGKYQGTWLHKELAFEFFGWCNPMFRRAMHRWVEKRINGEHLLKQHRLSLKTGFLPLTNAIEAAHESPKHYHYSNECDLINRIVTGTTAKRFKQSHGVESVRDALSAAQMKLMDKLQAQNTSLIELGFDYGARKQALSGYVTGLERLT